MVLDVFAAGRDLVAPGSRSRDTLGGPPHTPPGLPARPRRIPAISGLPADKIPGPYDVTKLPYRVAVLCYLFDEDDRLLLLHRRKEPNIDRYSPIGGKLELAEGESPHACAIREIEEESGLALDSDELRMMGMVSETAYEGTTHWLIFLFEVTRPVRHAEIPNMEFDEGVLEWVPAKRVSELDIPDTDRRALWPQVQRHRGGFFSIHIDCREDPFTWELLESMGGEPG
ncbi:MAG: NUDIX domain-containing protein [Planctomycetota bacterium]|nr:NUDIX domain-containing protein [Planctomycetota bacterium]